MARSYAIASLQILMVLLIASSAQSSSILKTEFTLYIHEYRSGPNTSIYPVAGRNDTPWGFDKFGTVFISDNLVTEGISAHSPEVGRIQGIAGIVALDGRNAEGLSSMLFTTGKYNGSTVEVKGLNQPIPVQELAIVGGTKLFRYATGYSTLQALSSEGGHNIIKFHLHIKQDRRLLDENEERSSWYSKFLTFL